MELRGDHGLLRVVGVACACLVLQVRGVTALDDTTALGIAAGCVLGVAALVLLLVLLWIKCRRRMTASLDGKKESYKSFANGEGDFVLSPDCYTITNPGFDLVPDPPEPVVLSTVPGVHTAVELPELVIETLSSPPQVDDLDAPQSGNPQTSLGQDAVSDVQLSDNALPATGQITFQFSSLPFSQSSLSGHDAVPDSPKSINSPTVPVHESVWDSPESLSPSASPVRDPKVPASFHSISSSEALDSDTSIDIRHAVDASAITDQCAVQNLPQPTVTTENVTQLSEAQSGT